MRNGIISMRFYRRISYFFYRIYAEIVTRLTVDQD
jgi:hypothetical protein